MTTYRMAYNGVDKENWIECRDQFMTRNRQVKSTFLNVNQLEKSGRDLMNDLKKTGARSVPHRFVKV